jgi:hypothetical protein
MNDAKCGASLERGRIVKKNMAERQMADLTATKRALVYLHA